MRSPVADPVGTHQVYAYDSPIGRLAIRIVDEAVSSIEFEGGGGTELPPGHAVRRWLDAYFAGDAPAVDVPMALVATPFQRAVLDAATSIPPGEVRTYGWVAAQIGRPRAARAVGRALGANPLPLVIPCHRVVASGPGGGYGGGMERKEYLLALEQRVRV
jgi:methylated-DNA-[protein]-cysteine S-methyltransferase